MSQPTVGTKYKGYAALSRYMDTGDGMLIFRGFGELHIRDLLYLQDEITSIEEKLHARDLMPGEHGCRRRDSDLMRRGIMKQLRVKLKDYGAWSFWADVSSSTLILDCRRSDARVSHHAEVRHS